MHMQNLDGTVFFFRFFEREEYALDFINLGRLFMRTADYYRTSEANTTAGRFDKNEGAFITSEMGAIMSLKNTDEVQWPKLKITNMGIGSKYFVYCFYTASSSDVHIKKGKQSVMINAPEFFNKLNQHLAKDSFLIGRVEYKDLTCPEIGNLLHRGCLRLFFKETRFSYQCETRLCISAPDGIKERILDLGDLSNIVELKKVH